jgi:hypothetical protein
MFALAVWLLFFSLFSRFVGAFRLVVLTATCQFLRPPDFLVFEVPASSFVVVYV